MKKTPMKAANERKTLVIKIRVNVGQLESYRLPLIEQIWTCPRGSGRSRLKRQKSGKRSLGPTQPVGPRFEFSSATSSFRDPQCSRFYLVNCDDGLCRKH